MQMKNVPLKELIRRESIRTVKICDLIFREFEFFEKIV